MSNPIYFILKIYIRYCLKFYFRKYQVNGLENIPHGPLLFVSNHQNAFLDALLITCSTKRNPYFLARASIFKKKWATMLLKIIRIIPIYRIRDGFSSVKKNDKIFDQCTQILSLGHPILIFPEGNHDNRFLLRPFQKGAGRIALETESRNGFNLNLQIVPVGIQYEEFDRVGNSVLVNIGLPISVSNYKMLYNDNSISAIQKITQDIEKAIRPLIINISSEYYLDTLEKWKNSRIARQNLKDQLLQDQKLIKEIENNPTKFQSIGGHTKKQKSNLIHYLFSITTKLHLVLPHLWISDRIAHKLKEPMFEGSMRFALWAFPGMIFLMIQSIILYLLTNHIGIALIYIGASIFIGRLAIITSK